MARTVWHRIEAINAVTYFAHECREAPAGLGLKGFPATPTSHQVRPTPAARVEHDGRSSPAVP